MKQLLLLICFIVSINGFSQSEKISLSPLTEVMLKKYYSPSEIQELTSFPQKLKIIDYLYSKSFEVPNHLKYTDEQFNKIDVNKYNSARKLNENALIFDEESGLSIVLYSLDKMEEDKAQLSPSSDKKNDPTSKIAH